MIRPLRQFLTLYEYYEEYRYISHYFVCEVTGKGRQRLTDAERRRGVEPRWLDLQEAVGLFSRHRDYAAVSEEKRGAYLREYTALREYLKPRAALRKMTGAEFQRFREYSVSDYAADLAKGEGLDLERAEETAEKEFLGMLPDGPDTENQFVMSVEDAETGRQAGWIWFCFEDGDSGRKAVPGHSERGAPGRHAASHGGGEGFAASRGPPTAIIMSARRAVCRSF